MRFVLAIAAMLVWTSQQSSCFAQTQSLQSMLPHPSAADAIADAYGRAIVASLAKLISEQADSACRKTRSLDDMALNRGAEAILVSSGAKLVALRSGRVTEEGLSRKLDELAGPGSAAAVRELADETHIKDLKRLLRAKFNDELVDQIADTFDQYVLIHRLLRGHLSPLAGNVALATSAADRAIEAEDAAKKEFGENAKLHRLIELYSALIDAYGIESIMSGSPTSSADLDAFQGVAKQLQALCVPFGG